MKMSEQFAGNYFKATDLPQPRILTIETVLQAKMPEGDTKPALRFVGESQQLVLNKTNAFICVEMFGDESIAWQGRQVELYSTQTSFSGRMVPCIRVRPPQQPVQQPVYQTPPVPPLMQARPVPQPVPPLMQPPQPHPMVQQQAVAPHPQQPMAAPPADYPVDA